MGQDGVYVPKVATLDGFTDMVNKNEGLHLTEIDAGKTVIVKTENSTYTILVLDPFKGEVVVTGGKFFPEPKRCILSGSSLGGALLKTRWIGMGMRLEFYSRDEASTDSDIFPLVTSTVQSISLVDLPSSNGTVH